MGFGNTENVRLGCINMEGNNTSNTHCGFAACRISPPYCQLTPPPPARPRSTSGHFNVTDRRNTPPEPHYTAVKIVSTQIRKDFVYIATFLSDQHQYWSYHIRHSLIKYQGCIHFNTVNDNFRIMGCISISSPGMD